MPHVDEELEANPSWDDLFVKGQTSENPRVLVSNAQWPLAQFLAPNNLQTHR